MLALWDLIQSCSGNFNEDKSYKKLGISIKDFDYILHSINSISLFDYFIKFSREAKKEAKLILLGGSLMFELKEDLEKLDLSMSRIYGVAEKSNKGQIDYTFISINR